MRFITAALVSAATANAFSLGDGLQFAQSGYKAAKRELTSLFPRSSGGGTCPAVWNQVATDMQAMFLDKTNGQCNDDARAAIRLAFHDCGTWDITQGTTGGCDGSIVNTINKAGNDAELNRGENNGLQDISQKMIALKASRAAYQAISMADMIQFGGACAITTCPGGPQVQTFVGRKDSSNPAPNGRLPDVHAPANDLYQLFENKGFNAKELAALLGAHSTSKSFHQLDIMPAGRPQDSTPGLWDVKYYQDTLTPPTGVIPFPSDTSLAAHPDVGKEFHGFVGNQGKWRGDFAKA
jgi:hypothetical protein